MPSRSCTASARPLFTATSNLITLVSHPMERRFLSIWATRKLQPTVSELSYLSGTREHLAMRRRSNILAAREPTSAPTCTRLVAHSILHSRHTNRPVSLHATLPYSKGRLTFLRFSSGLPAIHLKTRLTPSAHSAWESRNHRNRLRVIHAISHNWESFRLLSSNN